jgi:DNA modification methylase
MLDFLDNQESLDEFLKEHVKPYDPAADDYDRPPFATDIKEGKNDPIYKAHSYHTKVPPRGIVPYILHYTKPGDLILDPFCGSGMTGIAAQLCANPPADILAQYPEFKDRLGPRACILNDLSPAACHIAYNYNTPVDVNGLEQEFERIKAAVKEEFDWLYGTEHYEPAIGDYALTNPEVLARLKNPPASPSPKSEEGWGERFLFSGETEQAWTLLKRSEVEGRLGYPVIDLPRNKAWEDADVSNVEDWVCIPATIQYTIWSDVYRCEGFVTIEEPTGKISTRGKNVGKPIVQKRRVERGCGERIVIWDTAVNHQTGEVEEVFACPNCKLEWKKVHIQREEPVPVKVSVEYEGLCTRDKQGRITTQTCFRNVTELEKTLITKVSRTRPKGWLPSLHFDKSGPQYRRNALSARKIHLVTDLFLVRSLHALASLWQEIGTAKSNRLRNALQFAFTAILTRASRLSRLRPSGAGDPQTGTIYISSLTREDNVLRLFESRVRSHIETFRTRLREDCLVHLGSACSLGWLLDSSVDYIFTDPPFGSNIYYSEPNLILEAWLGRTTDATDEAVVHRKNDGGTKRLPDYARLMCLAFAEIYRVLKPGRWCTVEFNNSDGAVFEAIKGGIRQGGFEIINMLLLDKQQKTFKQIKGVDGVEDVVDKDIVFNLYKPPGAGVEVHTEDQDLEQQIVDIVRQQLQTLPVRIKADPLKYSDDHRTTATINSMLMNTLIPKGVNVERLNLPYIERVCSRYFRKVGQRWYLRGEAVGNGANSNLFEEEIQIKEEESAIAWLRQKLTSGPKAIGELKPFWMRAIGLLSSEISQQLDLDALLRENFWKDADTNRWREPSPAEREKMNDSRTLRVVHEAERYLAGTLKQQTGDIDRCDWIDVLFKACRAIEEQETEELPALRDFDPTIGYQMITQLFHGILKDHVPADIFGRAEKQARVASSRLKGAAEDGKQENQESKDKIQLEFDL